MEALCVSGEGGSQQVCGGGEVHSLAELLETGRPPGPNCVEGIRVRGPAGHPRPCRQGQAMSQTLRAEPAELSRCLSRDPTCPTHRLTSAAQR